MGTRISLLFIGEPACFQGNQFYTAQSLVLVPLREFKMVFEIMF